MTKFELAKTLVVGEMAANCYILVDKDLGHSLIIDPGGDAEYIERVLADTQTEPQAILLTHGHIDHVGAILDLKLNYNVNIFCPRKDMFLVEKYKFDKRLLNSLDKKFVSEEFGFKVIEVPGHTPGGVVYVSLASNCVFSGDLIFKDGYLGRTDFYYSDKLAFENSLKKLLRLDQSTTVYPGHGESFSLGDWLRLYRNIG